MTLETVEAEAFLDDLRTLEHGAWEVHIWLVDPPEKSFANNAPLFDFKCIECGLYCESHVNESQIWNCPRCWILDERPSPLRKVIRRSPTINRVWHGHHDLTTGHYVSDRKQFRELLHVQSEIDTERLGFQQNYIEVDMSDHKHLGITEQGLDSTHDRHVQLGWKESRGRFVFPMSSDKGK